MVCVHEAYQNFHGFFHSFIVEMKNYDYCRGYYYYHHVDFGDCGECEMWTYEIAVVDVVRIVDVAQFVNLVVVMVDVLST